MRSNRRNKIFKGNCLSILSDDKKVKNNSINLIVTSPPYAHQRNYEYGGIHPKKYVEWFLPIADQLYQVLKQNGSLILNIKENVKNCERQSYVLELVLELKKRGWLWIEEYCWYKKNSYPGKWRHRFRDSWERCFHFAKSRNFSMYQDAVKVPIGDWAQKRFRSLSESDFKRTISGTNSHFGRKVSNWLNRKKVYPHNVLVFESEHYCEPSNVIELPTECQNKNHSAVYPIELPTWFIKLFTKKNDHILDPFLGSGTTAVASLLMERSFIGIEEDENYVKLARSNIRSAEILLRNKRKEK